MTDVETSVAWCCGEVGVRVNDQTGELERSKDERSKYRERETKEDQTTEESKSDRESVVCEMVV
jgi:hypothetical protein